jgi:superfamily II DNA or RNA helicase
MAFRWPFRRYQALALDAYERRAPDHQRRSYIVMPPGSGKTALGLEIARRRGNPTVILCPNTAVQSQWLEQWAHFAPDVVPAGDATDLSAPLTALTYQALCNLNTDDEDLDRVALDLWQESVERERGIPADEARAEIERLEMAGNQHYRAELTRFRRRARRLIARGGDAGELLGLLHPNGQALVERIRGLGSCTLVLDECHHLLEMWGYLIRAVVEVAGPETFVLGLTATPPREMDQRESELYRALFGYADFEVPTPAVVKEGDLAAYQELGVLTEPLPHEAAYIDEQHVRFEELITRLLDVDFASRPLLDWIEARVVERRARDGSGVSWNRFERDNSDLARAALRLFHRFGKAPPPGVRLGERDRRPMTAADWVGLIDDFCMGYLRYSADPRDVAAWEDIRSVLPSLGYNLTRRGIRSYVSPVDRVLSLSASKATAAATILELESAALGSDLRALILCDYERAGSDIIAQLRGVLDPQAGSAMLLLEMLVADRDVAELDPILLTGRTVACSSRAAERLVDWLARAEPNLAGRLRLEPAFQEISTRQPDVGRALVAVRAATGAWTPRRYVSLITRYFEDGGCQCLVGTRGLLGEGWDAKRVNVLIDLTTASTSTAVHQMRGRSLRLDPLLPNKVANNWDVVCIDPSHPKGTADYERFVRKHRHYFAPTVEGEIESGVSHVHHELSPFGPPASQQIERINREMLERAGARDAAYERWEIGRPYESAEIHTVRLRPTRSLGVPNRRVLRRSGSDDPRRTITRRAWATVTGATLAGGTLMLAGLEPLAFASAAGFACAGAIWSVRPLQRSLASLQPSDNLEDFALATLEGLRAAGEVPDELDAGNIHVVAQADGYYRCYLSGVTQEQSRLFAEALDQLLAPLSTPRYIIPRYIADSPRSPAHALALGLRLALRGRTGSAVVYHAVPDVLARNRTLVAGFERAWNRHVSSGDALFYRSERAQAILAVQGGDDPFAVTSQMRVLWR